MNNQTQQARDVGKVLQYFGYSKDAFFLTPSNEPVLVYYQNVLARDRHVKLRRIRAVLTLLKDNYPGLSASAVFQAGMIEVRIVFPSRRRLAFFNLFHALARKAAALF